MQGTPERLYRSPFVAAGGTPGKVSPQKEGSPEREFPVREVNQLALQARMQLFFHGVFSSAFDRKTRRCRTASWTRHFSVPTGSPRI